MSLPAWTVGDHVQIYGEDGSTGEVVDTSDTAISVRWLDDWAMGSTNSPMRQRPGEVKQHHAAELVLPKWSKDSTVTRRSDGVVGKVVSDGYDNDGTCAFISNLPSLVISRSSLRVCF